MPSVPRSSRKRALVESIADEPLTHRSRHGVLEAQLETLQVELDHERSLRALDQKRYQQVQQRLERQVEFAVEETKEAKALMEELRKESEEYAKTLRTKHQALQQQYRDLQSALDEDRDQTVEPDPQIQHLQEQLRAKGHENQGLKDTIADLQEEIGRLMKRSSISAGSDNAVLQASPAPPNVMKELNSTRIQLAEAERKNRQLQRQNDELQRNSMEHLHQQERFQSATARVQHLQSELQDREQSLALAQAQVQSWNEFGVHISHLLNCSPPEKNVPPELAVIKRHLHEATKESKDTQSKNQILQTELDAADDKIQELQRTIRELEHAKSSWSQQQQHLNKRLDVAEKQVQVLQGQEAVWKRELESLRLIVKTFDELPLPGKPSETSDAKVRMIQASLDAVTQELQIIKNGKDTLKKELEVALQEKLNLQTTHNSVLEKFAKLKEAVYAERTKAEKAEARAVHAEELAGKGSFNPETTRVLHLQHNPLTEALKQENNVLRRQIEVLTTKSKKAVATTPVLDVDPNKLHQRLKESFKEQIGRFREGVYLLTGYKIDMIPDGDKPKFKVRSMFAEREQDHLLFQWPSVTPVESLDLLDTELAKVLMTTPSYEYVVRFHSLPAFLASTQLSLFEKQTML